MRVRCYHDYEARLEMYQLESQDSFLTKLCILIPRLEIVFKDCLLLTHASSDTISQAIAAKS
jgi:hypothetical protein